MFAGHQREFAGRAVLVMQNQFGDGYAGFLVLQKTGAMKQMNPGAAAANRNVVHSRGKYLSRVE